MRKLTAFFTNPLGATLTTILLTTVAGYSYFNGVGVLGEILTALGVALLIAFLYEKPERCLYLLIFAIPFNGYDIIGPIRFTEIITLLTIVVYVMRVARGKHTDGVKLTPLFLVLGAFVVSNAISAFGSIVPQVSAQRILVLGYLVALSFLVGQLIGKRETLEKLVRVLLISFATFGLYGLAQFVSPWYRTVAFANVWNVNGLPRITLFYGDPNLVSGYMVVAILFCLSLYLNNLYRKTWLLHIALISMLLCIVLTFSRSGLLALVVGCSVLITMNLRPAVVKRVLFGLGGGFLVLALTYNTVTPVKKILQPAVLRITQITDTRVESVGARFIAYEAAIDMVSDHPFFGVGPDVFPYEYDVRTGILAPEKHVVPHNLVLEIVAEKGLVGLSLYLGFILILVYAIRRSLQQLESDDAVTRAVLQWILAWLPAFFTLTLFLTGMYEVYFWLLTGIVYAISTRLPWRKQS
ncbi:hypothetical protein BH11PAT4_BH11PAT4_1690 [soil metagenome]